MKLESFWLAKNSGEALTSPHKYFKREPSSHQELTTDVVVIGGGITGVSLAYWLVQNGKNVTLIEKREISSGATGRNGGHLWPATSESMFELYNRIGKEAANAIFHFGYASSEHLKEFIKEHHISCELTERGGLDLSTSPKEWEEAQKGFQFLNEKNLIKNIVLLNERDVYNKAPFPSNNWNGSEKFCYGGLYDPNACQLWPAKLVYGILALTEKMAKEKGLVLNILTQTCVVQVDRQSPSLRSITNERFTVYTDHLDVIHCEHLAHCTDGYSQSPSLLPKAWSHIVYPLRGQVIVTEPYSGPLFDTVGSLCFNYSWEYLIHRSFDKRIVFGGFNHLIQGGQKGISDDSVVLSAITQKLQETLDKILGVHLNVEYAWSGIMGFSPDKLPIVGMLPNYEHEWVAMGTSGSGMPFAWGMAKCLADAIATRSTGYSSGVGESEKRPNLSFVYCESDQNRNYTLPEAFSPLRFLN